MATSREDPNPLRPYYIPPSIGIATEPPAPGSSISHNITSSHGANPSYASSARDMFSDIDYSDYLSSSSPSTVQSVRAMIDSGLYKYTSVLLAHPFEVAKTVLQVKGPVASGATAAPAPEEDYFDGRTTYRDPRYGGDLSDESDPEEEAYFTSSAHAAQSYSSSRSKRRQPTDRDGYVIPSPTGSTPAPHQLTLKQRDSLLEVISQVWAKEGAWGVWKGTNATFVYGVLLKTIENWSRGLFSAMFNIPDPGAIEGLGTSAVDVIESQYPWASLGVAVAAAVSAGIILAPLDLVRTKLIITPTSTPKRSVAQSLRALSSYLCPTNLILPTTLHSSISPIFAHATPLLLRSHFGIDPVHTPTTFSMATFLSSTVELFTKLPFETVLRRGQVSVLSSQVQAQGGVKQLDTIVNVGPYRGVLGTMWSIVREEGETPELIAMGAAPRTIGKKSTIKKGQGIDGLWRGWRVGMWGLVGIWTAAAMGSSAAGEGEF